MPIPRAYRNDPDAPWNDDPVPECPECQEKIRDIEYHADWCESKPTQEEIREHYAVEQHPTEPEDHPDYEL